jgi:hypothetical protein
MPRLLSLLVGSACAVFGLVKVPVAVIEKSMTGLVVGTFLLFLGLYILGKSAKA